MLSVMACACVPSIPPLPSDGGPEWLELKTAHVTLWTDASAKHARELVREVEWRRQMVLAVMRGRAALNSTAGETRIVAVALRDWLEAGEYGANLAWSAYTVIGQPGVLLCADDKRRNYSVNHELAHAMTDYEPFWLDEGTASYFEQIEFTPDGTSIVIGAVPSWMLWVPKILTPEFRKF